jgi:hypothetical protein
VISTGNNRLDNALTQFFDTIESTGGVTKSAKGLYEPGGDPDWVDLGEAYVNLAEAVGHTPVILSPISDYGDLMTIDDFGNAVKGGAFIDYDGSGNWATELHYAQHLSVQPSSFFKAARPPWATHVLWFNR